MLLRGVNDDAATLEALMRAFVECRIKPYYLHHGDLAPGTAHLRTTLEQGPGIDACAARPGVRIVPAGLCARYSRRARQGAGRSELSVARKFNSGKVNIPEIALSYRRLLRRRSSLSAGAMIDR